MHPFRIRRVRVKGDKSVIMVSAGDEIQGNMDVRGTNKFYCKFM